MNMSKRKTCEKDLFDFVAPMLNYDPTTGKFLWNAKPVLKREDVSWNSKFAGNTAGTKMRNGYIRISIMFLGKRTPVSAHRLAFYLANGYVPTYVDHENHVRDDNRSANLKEASLQDNQRNRKLNSNTTSGISGVYWCKTYEKWVAHTKVDGKKVFLGNYNTKEQAAYARAKSDAELGFHDNHGL